MARRKKKFEVDKKAIIAAFSEMAKHKSIDRDLLQGIIEETISMIIKKKHGLEAKFEIIVNMDKGDIEIYLMRQIVEDPGDPNLEISLEEANKYSEEDEEYEIGDEFIEEITLSNIADNFGRRLISLASQTLNQRIREIEKDNVYNQYVNRVGEVIVGEIYQIRRHDLLILHEGNEMRLPRDEQIPNEPYKYRKNQTIKAILKEVRRSGQSGQPDIILSRASESFLQKLFEVEIPEIYDGIINIKAIARDPGERSKVSVVSFDDRVDPVGACVGMKGMRIHSIVRELNNENIDLIQYAEHAQTYISRALSPAKVKDIVVDAETRSASVTVAEDQVSLAIGKNGQNVRLASKLTGYNITLIKEGGEDIDLEEFKEELGIDLFYDLQDAGIESARDFLEADPEFMLSFDDMTIEQLLELRQIMLNEFDEEESQDMIDKIKALENTVKTEDSETSESSTEENAQENTEENAESNTDQQEI